jgi:hypothetical protein
MEKAFKLGLVIGIFAIAIALFEYSRNARYQYSTHGDQGVVLDTRTGEFWTEDGSHFEPKKARVTLHHPTIDDVTAHDDRANRLNECLKSHTDPKKCLAEFSAAKSLETSSSQH